MLLEQLSKMCMGELYFNSKLQIEYTGEKKINFNFVNNILQRSSC